MNTSPTLITIKACWSANCSHEQTAKIVLTLTGTHLSEAAIIDHYADFKSEDHTP